MNNKEHTNYTKSTKSKWFILDLTRQLVTVESDVPYKSQQEQNQVGMLVFLKLVC